MSTSDLITTVIAVYGAALSTLLLVREARRERRHLKIDCALAMAAPRAGEIWHFVSLKVVNTGHRPVTVQAAGLVLSDNTKLVQLSSRMGPRPLPKKLEDGESVDIWFDLDGLRDALRDINNRSIRVVRASVVDAEGHTYSVPVPKEVTDVRPSG